MFTQSRTTVLQENKIFLQLYRVNNWDRDFVLREEIRQMQNGLYAPKREKGVEFRFLCYDKELRSKSPQAE